METPTITVGDAPAAQETKTSGPPSVTDSTGRRLVLRELTILEEQDIIGAVGEPNCINRLYMGRILAAARIAEIDGDPVPPPVTAREVRAMLQRIGRPGLTAVMSMVEDEAASAGEEAALAKN